MTLPVSYSRFGERLVCRRTWLIAAVERPLRQHDALPSAISRFGGEIWRVARVVAGRGEGHALRRYTAASLVAFFFVRQMHSRTIIPMQAYTCIICLRPSSGWRVLVNYWLWWPRGTACTRSDASSQEPYGHGHAVLKVNHLWAVRYCVRVKEGHGAMM